MSTSQSNVFTQSTYRSIHAQSNLAIREIKLLYICWQTQQSHFGKSWFISQLSPSTHHNINKVLWLLNMRGFYDFVTLCKIDLWPDIIITLVFIWYLIAKIIWKKVVCHSVNHNRFVDLTAKLFHCMRFSLFKFPGSLYVYQLYAHFPATLPTSSFLFKAQEAPVNYKIKKWDQL